LTVSVLEVRGPRESTREGGSARFTITVVESGEALFPAAIVDTAQSVQDKADGAGGAICDSFGGTFNATDGPAFVFEHSKTLIAKVTDQLDALRRQTPGVPSKITQYVADLKDFSASVESLIRTPADLAVQIYGLIADLARLPDRPIRALNAYRPLWDALSREPDIARTTGVRSMQADNQAALTSLVRRAAVTEAVRTSAVIEYDSYDDAVALRDELAARIDVEIETADDQSYRALTDLRVALVRDMASRAADLARVVRFTPSATVPAVVLAHRLYDDPGRESEIVARNRIRHPGFIVGGTILEVLTDA
jgi:prophage DNA circulation protein